MGLISNMFDNTSVVVHILLKYTLFHCQIHMQDQSITFFLSKPFYFSYWFGFPIALVSSKQNEK